MTTEQMTPTAYDVLGIFEFLGLDASNERVQGIAAEIESGERNLVDVRNDLLQFIADQDPERSIEDVTGDFLRRVFEEEGAGIATGDETLEERIERLVGEVLAGREGDLDTGRTFEDIREGIRSSRDPSQMGIEDRPVTIGDATIPAGGRIIEVMDPSGADADSLYRVVYTFNGVEYSYEIGDETRFNELFGRDGVKKFTSYTRMDQAEWDESGILVVGNIDEKLGATESEASLIERELSALGYEGTPSWWDDEVTTLYIQGIGAGWSSEAIALAISETDAFGRRFPGLDAFMAGRGITDIVAASGAYILEEDTLRATLRRYRGPDADVSQEYLGDLLATGWTAEQIQPIVAAERDLRLSEEGVDNLNEILAYHGMDLVDEDGFIDVMTGNAPVDVYEAINDALRRQALEEAGVDIDVEFAAQLGDGTSTDVLDITTFTAAAQATAASLARNANALDLERFGLQREDIIAAMFNEESPTGKTAGEITDILGKLQREAQYSAGGYAGGVSFLDAQGRLRIQGYANT